MIRFAADQNFDHNILRGLLRMQPDLDIATLDSAGLSRDKDPAVLEWAANEGRILLTHDVNTMTAFAFERVRAGRSMPGVFCIGRDVTIGQAIEDLLLIVGVSIEGEWEGQVRFLPL